MTMFTATRAPPGQRAAGGLSPYPIRSRLMAEQYSLGSETACYTRADSRPPTDVPWTRTRRKTMPTTTNTSHHGWALLLLWGIAWVILGFFLLFQPGMTAIVLVQIMAVFWVVGGVVDLMNGLTHREQPGRGWRVVGGILGIVAGVIIMIHPIAGTLVTIAFGFYLLAFAALVTGIINLVGGFQKTLSWGVSLLGLAQIILGIFLVTHPVVGMLAYVPTLGVLAIVAGIVIIISSFRVRRMIETAPAV